MRRLLSNTVVSVAIGLLFLVVVAPLGLMMRVCGRDRLRQRPDKAVASYWIPYDPRRGAGDRMTTQS
jgi:hypothetical protein